MRATVAGDRLVIEDVELSVREAFIAVGREDDWVAAWWDWNGNGKRIIYVPAPEQTGQRSLRVWVKLDGEVTMLDKIPG